MTNGLDEIFTALSNSGFGDIHFKYDPKTDLKAIIAIHNTKRGPALGGCRFLHYASTTDAVVDALRLAEGMSYKAAISDLPLGGGKAVILEPKHIEDRKVFFKSFGKFVNELGGRYITAKDSGSHIEDMDNIATETKFVAGTSLDKHTSGNPSPYTARGVMRGIEAAVNFKFGNDSLQGLRVSIQGVGDVGADIAETLYKQGAILTICDTNQESIDKCLQRADAKVVTTNEIYDVESDIFSPCALGGVVNETTFKRLKTKIIAGCANNQLSTPAIGKLLHDQGVLYAPDYLINAGGLIHVYAQYYHASVAESDKKIDGIYETAMKIFQRSSKENRPTSEIVDVIAKELIQ